MTTAAHAMTGAAIAAVVKKPKLAIPLAFLSHFVCDALPHLGLGFRFGSTNMFIYLLADGLVAIGLAALLLKRRVENPVLLAISGFAAMSPDLAWLVYGLVGKQGEVASMDPFTHFHYVIQWGETKWGAIFDALWIWLMYTVIMKVQHEDHKNSAASQTAG